MLNTLFVINSFNNPCLLITSPTPRKFCGARGRRQSRDGDVFKINDGGRTATSRLCNTALKRWLEGTPSSCATLILISFTANSNLRFRNPNWSKLSSRVCFTVGSTTVSVPRPNGAGWMASETATVSLSERGRPTNPFPWMWIPGLTIIPTDTNDPMLLVSLRLSSSRYLSSSVVPLSIRSPFSVFVLMVKVGLFH